MAYKAIGFDIDGTLYPSFRLNRALLGFGLRNYAYLKAFSAVRRELRDLALSQEYRSSPPGDIMEFHGFQASLVARRLGLDEETVAPRVENLFYREIPECFTRVRPFRGLKKALRQLKDAGFRLGALSDFPGERKLELMGLDEFFPVTMTSEETGFLKPDPKPMQVLARRLGVAAHELLYVGNSEEYDVASAKAVGAGAAYLRPLFGRDAVDADYSFRRYDRLVEWILSRR